MALAAPDISYLDFLGCEVTHDKLMLKTFLIKGAPAFSAIIANMGNVCLLSQEHGTPLLTKKAAAAYPNSYHANDDILQENEFVQRMFSETKYTLCTSTMAPANFAFHSKPVTKLDPHRTISTIPCNIIFYPRSTIAQRHTAFQHMFTGAGADSYFVCDSTSHFIGYLSTSTISPFPTRIHLMFSSATYADPSSIFHSLSKHAISKKPNIIKITHSYLTAFSMPECDSMSMLDITVDHVQTNIKVDETIRYPARYNANPPTLTILDAKKNTSKAQVRIKMKNKNKAQQFYIAQSKRLGDHHQIKFAKWLIHNGHAALTSTQRISQRSPVNTPSFPLPHGTIDPDVNNVFFVTHDWPAFCFSVFNNINSIMLTDSPKGFLIVRN